MPKNSHGKNDEKRRPNLLIFKKKATEKKIPVGKCMEYSCFLFQAINILTLYRIKVNMPFHFSPIYTISPAKKRKNHDFTIFLFKITKGIMLRNRMEEYICV